MKFFLRTILIVSVFCLLSCSSYADEVMVIVSPVNITTPGSSYGIYPNISSFISKDLINELNKSSRFNAPDINSADSMIMSQGLYSNYKNFMKDYKENGIIDYKTCDLFYNKLGFDKMMLVSSAFSMQSMILKRPLLYKLGFVDIEPIQSFYKLNVNVAYLDTQSCIVEFKKSYDKEIKAENFEVFTNSFSDNIVSSKEIQNLSNEITTDVYAKMTNQTRLSGITKVRSNIVRTFNNKVKKMNAITTRDGHSYSTNNEYLKNKRQESFKSWIREKAF